MPLYRCTQDLFYKPIGKRDLGRPRKCEMIRFSLGMGHNGSNIFWKKI